VEKKMYHVEEKQHAPRSCGRIGTGKYTRKVLAARIQAIGE
jgi:hypothetical protein